MVGGNTLSELEREGHRARMRATYINGGMDNVPDHNLLELFLSILIPRKDVKELSYTLINHFGSLDSVLDADVQDLMKIKGIGESTAVAISLVKDLYKRASLNRNNRIKAIDNLNDCFEYCKNLYSTDVVENAYLITLDNLNRIINCHCVGSGSANQTEVDDKKVVATAIRDNAVGVIITHNHPGLSATPSAFDLNYSIKLSQMLEFVGIKLVDHIIVGCDECVSLNHNETINIKL